MSGAREFAACYRLYAANCIELAQQAGDADRRLFLLRMAEAWGKLADHAEKMKFPTSTIKQPEAQKAYTTAAGHIRTRAERVRHVVQITFNGRRILIFDGGATKPKDEDVFDEARAIRDGGGFGSIIGRNSFQRPKEHALKFLESIMSIYAGEMK